ncbi:gliding motility-associated C-terminal domain-containing protein [Mangrovimonas futianensis]|uniref:gliding motility-associated C-terminal domain-containing protein n=1 Tax=Mangrovimonas futianensis TaxID=2895523 RepID=UPI001E5ED28B|nr:gliding motility-associated C-terminal domain-containing protein [Mangrovimonas futianensis]MCF1422852.1 gliding motility-associated C-terminal domain-containing protein [Mangrovimonas futianensis]
MKKSTHPFFYNHLLFSLGLIFLWSSIAFSQCPTINDNSQSFCDIDSPTIADLVAVDNGSGINWFDSPTSTTPLASDLGLENATVYYVDNTNGDCGSRQEVTITIYGAPTGLNFQGVCVDDLSEATISDLFAVGNNVQWYAVPNGGAALAPTTILSDNTLYYADQENPDTGCRTSRLSVLVNVGYVPVPSGDGLQFFCGTQDPPPTVADLVASGNNNWYATNSSAVPLDLNTPLVAGETYYATTVDPPCESEDRLEVIIQFVPPNNAGESNSLEFCNNGLNTIGSIDLFTYLGGNPDTNGEWSGPVTTTNDHLGTLSMNGLNIGNSPYVFTYNIDDNNPCGTTSATITISILPPPNAGNDGDITVCSDGTPVDLFDYINGNPDLGGTWSPPLNSGSSIFDPQFDSAGDYTYTVSLFPCDDDTAVISVTMTLEPNAGNSASVDICSNDDPIDLFTVLGGTPDLGGTWSPALNSGSGLFDPTIDAEGTYTYTVDGAPPCGSASASVTIGIIPPPDAGTNGSANICGNDDPIDLFTLLGGTPDTGGTWSPVLASGTGLFDPTVDAEGTYTYTVEGTDPCGPTSATVTISLETPPNAGTNGSVDICQNDSPIDLFTVLGGTPDLGGTWSPALNSGSGLFDPTIDAEGTYTYTVGGTDPCGPASATVTVTIIPPPNAGTDGSANICGNDDPIDLFTLLGGTPDTGGTWSPALNSGSGLFDPTVDAEGTYAYTVEGTDPCGPTSATVTISLETPPNAGTNGSIDICQNDSPIDLFTVLGGTPDVGGSWSPALNSGSGLFDPTIDAEGTYTYTVDGTDPCGPASATVTVALIPPPNAGTDGSANICGNDDPIDLFTLLGGTPDTGGTWSPALNSGSGLFDPTIDAEGTYTYTVEGTDACGPASATVTISLETPPNAGTNGSVDICQNDSPIDLFTVLDGTPDVGGTWSPALNSGSGLFDPTIDAEGTYTYTVVGTDPCGPASATVTVTIIPPPNAGTDGSANICGNDDPIDLFTLLGGTPDTGGTWSPALNSGSGLFDPTVDAEGTYTYTVEGTDTCGPASATVTISLETPPNAGTNGSVDICQNDNPIDLFTVLGGTPDVGGTWSPALNSGSGLFDPTIDAEGTYSYTIDGTDPCGPASANVTVTIIPPPNAGTDGSANICGNDDPIDLFTLLGGTPDTGGTWSPLLASGAGLFDPTVDAEGTYTYTVEGTDACGPASASVTISVETPANPGTDASINLCELDNPIDLFTVLGGTPDVGGTWSPALNSGSGLFDPTIDAEGTYTYTVAGTDPCGPASATVTVTIIPPPNAGTDGSANICGNDDPIDLFTLLGGTPDTGGTWSPVLASGTGLFDPTVDAEGTYTYTVSNSCGTETSDVNIIIQPIPDISGMVLSAADICLNDSNTVFISNAEFLEDGPYQINYTLSGANNSNETTDVDISDGNGEIIIPNDILINSGSTAFTIIYFIRSTDDCSGDVTLVESVTFNIENTATPTLVDGGDYFCSEDSPTIEDLTSFVNESPIVWYDAPDGGNVITSETQLEDGETYYAAISSQMGCESRLRLEVTVTIEKCTEDLIIPDGFSPNGDGINDTFDLVNIRELYPNFDIEIYNRYGNLLFKGNSSTPNWDGTSKEGTTLGNGELPNGVYFYILNFNDGQTDSIQGRVYLNR